MEEGDTSKRRSFSGSCGEMTNKVSLHQTHELQTVPAQRPDETIPFTKLESDCAAGRVWMCVCMCLCSKVLGQ